MTDWSCLEITKSSGKIFNPVLGFRYSEFQEDIRQKKNVIKNMPIYDSQRHPRRSNIQTNTNSLQICHSNAPKFSSKKLEEQLWKLERNKKKSVKSSSRHGRNFVALSVLLLRRPCHERRFTLHVSAALRRPVVRNKNSPHSELTSTFQRRLLVLVFLCHFGASITHRWQVSGASAADTLHRALVEPPPLRRGGRSTLNTCFQLKKRSSVAQGFDSYRRALFQAQISELALDKQIHARPCYRVQWQHAARHERVSNNFTFLCTHSICIGWQCGKKCHFRQFRRITPRPGAWGCKQQNSPNAANW